MTDLGLSTESVSRTLTDRQGSDSPSESEDEGSSSNSCKRAPRAPSPAPVLIRVSSVGFSVSARPRRG